MKRLLGWLSSGSRGRPEPSKGEYQLWEAPRPPRKTLSPKPAPEGEDQSVLDFYQKSEWMQPYFNRILGGGGTWDFDELEGHYVTLGTHDGPQTGRTFEIRSNAAVVGKLSVIPEWSYPKYGPPWAELRLRLNYPIEAMPARDVHYLLSALADCAIGEQKDGKHSPLAEAEATKAMTKALWDVRDLGGSSVIDMNVEGPWTNYLHTVDNWKEKGIDPWEKYETRRDHR